MRDSLLAFGLALIAAGCTPDICARSSDCSSGKVCVVSGLCAIPADASTDGHADDAGSTAIGDAPAALYDAVPDGSPDAPIAPIAPVTQASDARRRR